MDTRDFAGHVGDQDGTPWLHANEQRTSWRSFGAGVVHDCPAAWHHAQGGSKFSDRVTAQLTPQQIGYVTCDNASNMDTMASEFAKQIEEVTGKPWDAKKRRVR